MGGCWSCVGEGAGSYRSRVRVVPAVSGGGSGSAGLRGSPAAGGAELLRVRAEMELWAHCLPTHFHSQTHTLSISLPHSLCCFSTGHCLCVYVCVCVCGWVCVSHTTLDTPPFCLTFTHPLSLSLSFSRVPFHLFCSRFSHCVRPSSMSSFLCFLNYPSNNMAHSLGSP